MSTICDLINNYKPALTSTLSQNASLFKPAFKPASAEKQEIKLLSWSIYHKLYNKLYNKQKNDIYKYKNKEEKRIEINGYITKTNPDILFTQESKVELGGYDIYSNYQLKTYIYLKKSIFSVKKSVIYYYNNTDKKYIEYIKGQNLPKNIKREIRVIKLQHNSTKQFFIFVNVLFQIEYENNSPKTKTMTTMTDADYSKFITTITDIIGKLSNDKDKDEDNIRIIIAGDFSGISNFFKINKKEDLKIKIGIKEITLYLKQNQNTCCGSETSQFKFDKTNPDKTKPDKTNNDKRKNLVINDIIITSDDALKHNSDLFYDSHNNTNVTVETGQKISNHHPIIGTISVLPVTESHAGGNIKHTNLTIKSKKLKITKKLKTTKKK